MKYFETLPKVVYSDAQGNLQLMTNLMARASVIKSLADNPLLYYTYDIQEGDTPEIIAHKYYGDVYRYWIVLLFNNIFDPEWDWPLNGTDFEKYVSTKYNFNVYSTVHHYEKTVTQFDSTTQITTVNTVNISADDFQLFQPSQVTYNLPTGNVTVTTTAAPVTYYQYEFNLNEAKRNIKILNADYVDQIESEFTNLMNP